MKSIHDLTHIVVTCHLLADDTDAVAFVMRERVDDEAHTVGKLVFSVFVIGDDSIDLKCSC